MNLKFNLLFLLLSISFNAQNIDVMSFNIRLSLDSDGENSWNNRKTEAMALINYYHPDVFGVQEAVPQQMLDLKNTLTDYLFVGVGREDGKDKGEYSAIFYDAKKFKILNSGTFWLSETPEIPSKGWDAAFNRVCTYALFSTLKGSLKFWVFNTHLDHIGVEARKNSAKLILEKIKQFNAKQYPIILTGDFNLTENTEPIKIISSTLLDTYYHSEKPHYGPKATFQGFNTQEIPKDRIDYIFVKDFISLSNRTINDRRENLLYPSDHFPVLVKLKFKN